MSSPTPPSSPPSDPVEQVAAGVEGFGRGLTAHATDTVGSALAGGPDPSKAARAEKYPWTSNMSEFAGSTLRMIGAQAIAGPMGLFANGALNVAGESADAAYNHDPRLTREHVLKSTIVELLSAAAGAAAPWAVSGVKASGKWLAGKAVAQGAETLEPYAANYVKGGGTLEQLSEKALKEGVFAKTQAAAAAHAEGEMSKTGALMGVFHAQADQLAASVPRPYRVAVFKAADAADKQLLQNKTPAARTVVKRLMREIRDPALTPSGLLRAEGNLRDVIKTANDANDGYTTHVMSDLLEQVKGSSDHMLQTLGMHAPAYRELQNSYAGAVALKEAASKVGGGEAAKAAGMFAAKEAAATAMGSMVPGPGSKWIAGGLVAAQSGPATAKTIARTGPSLVSQALYNSGTAASELDQNAFAVWLGQQMKTNASAVTKAGSRIGAAQASRPAADAITQLLTAHTTTPDAVKRSVADILENSKLPQAHKDAGMHDVDMALMSAKALLPSRVAVPNGLAPKASRQLSTQEKRRIQDYMHALVAPEDVMNHPTAQGIAALRNHFPASYAAFGADLVRQLGPNAPINSPLRRLAEKHGLGDQVMKSTGLILQNLYDHAATPPPPPGAKGNAVKPNKEVRQGAGPAQTGQEGVQARKQAGE